MRKLLFEWANITQQNQQQQQPQLQQQQKKASVQFYLRKR